MAHFAQLNEDNTVIRVIVVGNKDCLDENGNESESIGIAFCKTLFGLNTRWVQTSYNGSFRKNFAGIGAVYDSSRDAFISNQPFASWTLNEETCKWQAPVEYPADGSIYEWDEGSCSWLQISPSPSKDY